MYVYYTQRGHKLRIPRAKEAQFSPECGINASRPYTGTIMEMTLVKMAVNSYRKLMMRTAMYKLWNRYNNGAKKIHTEKT